MKLAKGEHIVTAFAEHAYGPGWSNTPIKVVIGDRNGQLRLEYIQPDEQTAEMYALYGVSAAAHGAMLRAVESATTKRRKP